MRRSSMKPIIVAGALMLLISCGGGGGGGGALSIPAAPFIFAKLASFPTGSVPNGLIPSGFNSMASVYVIDFDSGDPVANAKVTMNGISLTYNVANQDYEGNLSVGPGEDVTLRAEVWGITYKASGAQFTAYPTIAEPTIGATWHIAYGSYVTWAGPSSTGLSGVFYGIGVVDAADANGQLIWPSSGVFASILGGNSYTIPANSLTVGNRLLLLGIAKEIPIPHAALDSAFDITGFSSAPVTVADAALTSISVEPSNMSIIKGTTLQYTATGTFTDTTTQNMNGEVVWSTPYPGAPATIDKTGLATGVRVGSIPITASLGTFSDSTWIWVMPGTINSITLAPMKAWLDKGRTQQYTATGLFSDNSTRDITSQVTWTSSDETKVTIDAKGLATGSGVGSATITATLWETSASTPVKLVAGFDDATRYPGIKINNYSFFDGNTALGDLNGDGRNDVAILEMTGWRILVYSQNSSGTFDPPAVIATDVMLQNAAIADIDNDGLRELIVSGNATTLTPGSPGKVEIFKQDPVTHLLGTPKIYTLSTNTVVSMAVADLNGDGLPDVVVSGLGSGANGVLSFLFQQSDGTLGPEVTYTSVPVYYNGEIHVADMDNNGLNDVALLSGGQVAVIKQTTPGVFSTSPDYYTPQFSISFWAPTFALGDVNGDGLADLIVADPGYDPGYGGILNIFLQNANGMLSGPTFITIPRLLQDEVHVTDLDGDGLKDIIILSGGRDVNILYQYPDHTFSSISEYYLPGGITGGTNYHQLLSVGDVTSDGLSDIVTAWTIDGLYVLRRRP